MSASTSLSQSRAAFPAIQHREQGFQPSFPAPHSLWFPVPSFRPSPWLGRITGASRPHWFHWLRLCPEPQLHSQALLIRAKDNSRRNEKISSLGLQSAFGKEEITTMCFLSAALGLPAGAQRSLRGSLWISTAARRLLELHGFGILSTRFYYFLSSSTVENHSWVSSQGSDWN